MRFNFHVFQILIATITVASTVPVIASDGVLEINQACAVNTGCFAGDSPGFPVSITTPGSYVLTGNLSVSDPAKSGIWLETAAVTIDLNGFEIDGPVNCTGAGSTMTCDAGTGRGIMGSGRPRITVRNGTVSNFGAEGIRLSGTARVVDVIAQRNGGNGIEVLDDSIITRSRAYLNGGHGIVTRRSSTVENCTSAINHDNGISVGDGTVVVSSTARDNGHYGIEGTDNVVVRGSSATFNESIGIRVSSNSTVVKNTANDNGHTGINAFAGCVCSDNVASSNAASGINASSGSTISGNTVKANTNSGIQANSGSNISGNTVRDNGTVGLSLSFDSTYRDNTITDNGTGTVLNGENLGGNYCSGFAVTSSSCP